MNRRQAKKKSKIRMQKYIDRHPEFMPILKETMWIIFKRHWKEKKNANY